MIDGLSVIAKRRYRPFDLAMNKIWISFESYEGCRYILLHFMNFEDKFGGSYVVCENISQLNDVKSKITNNGFKMDWSVFNVAMEYLNDH